MFEKIAFVFFAITIAVMMFFTAKQNDRNVTEYAKQLKQQNRIYINYLQK